MHAKKEVLCCKFLIFNNCYFVCFRVFLLYTSTYLIYIRTNLRILSRTRPQIVYRFIVHIILYYHACYNWYHIKTFPFMENMLKYDFMKYRHRLLYYRVAPIYIRYTLLLYTTKKKTKLTNLIIFTIIFITLTEINNEAHHVAKQNK
jgi:hypothetical protein